MIRGHRKRELIDNFILPILLTLLLIVLSQLLGLVHLRPFAGGVGVLAVVFVGAWATQYYAFRSIRRQERDALYDVISALAFSETTRVRSSGLLSASEVLALESAAREVWIYAYDLAWEGDESPFTNVVASNISRGVPYRYLVPSTPDVLLRVEQICRDLEQITGAGQLARFRSSERERLITQFGLTIYNPTFLHETQRSGAANLTEPVAVFFPHFGQFAAGEALPDVPFLALRGRSTVRLQEAFVAAWNEALEVVRS